MKTFSIKFLLLVSILAGFSCKGPKQKEHDGSISVTKAMGDQVAELDKSIWVIFQDSRGYNWYGSNGSGAYWHDGVHLWQYTTLDGLASDQIRGIQEDKKGNIYFDTPDGVSKFDREKFVTLVPVESTTNQWKLDSGDLWFKGNGDVQGAYRYDGDSLYQLEFSEFGAKISGDEYSTYSIYKDRQGNIWFGTLSGGVCRFDGTTLSWLYEHELGELADGRVPGVRSIIEDNDGLFWLSNIISRYRINPDDPDAPGIIQYDKRKGIDSLKHQEYMKLPYFNSAVFDKKTGDLWMSNYNEGVWKYDGGKLTHYPIKDGQTHVFIVSIYKDRNGMLWLATDNVGVYKWNGRKFEKFEF